ncbi:hypothetical protein C8Q76DRAFT_626444, partial [Earliella scabrosa]
MLVFTTLRARRAEDKVISGRLAFEKCLREERVDPSFLNQADGELRDSIIREWQGTINTANFRQTVCASCARSFAQKDCKQVEPSAFDLTLLRNEALPLKVRPTTYNFALYSNALLCPAGMSDRWRLSLLTLCSVCFRELVGHGRMPKLCLGNGLYYAYDELPGPVRAAFRSSSQFDRMLVARARGSKISYRFTELRNREAEFWSEPSNFTNRSGSQRFIKGNILIMPQNSTYVNEVLPPPPAVIKDTVCAVFVGKAEPTKESIGKLSPVLARKSTVSTIIQFLVRENEHYMCDSTFHGCSARNLDLLFEPQQGNADQGVPCAMDVGFIEDTDAIRSVTADYSGRNEVVDVPESQDSILMENVGYTNGDDSPVSYRDMKMKALSHCLNGGKFIRSQAGDQFVPDFENPSLLTWMFPHLDPWGIGGFHQQEREIPISMEEQLKYLLQIHESPFARDADFAFVYFNILQKKSVCDSVKFKVKQSQQHEIVRQLLEVDKDLLNGMISRYKRDPGYEPDTREELSLLSLINRVGTVLHDLPGTSGYKIKMRNEIRGLVSQKGTPAFFVTLNPSDVHNPLVRLLAGQNVSLESMEVGEELSEWGRRLLVARDPGACAKFFHTMISSFINIILRYGRKERGLFG